MRAPVDSSESTSRPLAFSRERASSASSAARARSLELRGDHRDGLGEVLGPRADIQPDLAGAAYRLENENTEYASPRRSRTSWKSREDAPPPSIVSSTRSAKRRSSSREIPPPPRHRWYCSVSLRRKRTRRSNRGSPNRAARCRRRRIAAGVAGGARPSAARASSTSALVVDRARRRDHDVRRHVALAVERAQLLARRPRRRPRRVRSPRGPADAPRRPPRRARRRRGPEGRLRTSRSLRARPRARPRARRSAGATPCPRSRRTPAPNGDPGCVCRPRSSPCRSPR